MLFPRVLTALAFASALSGAEPLDPRIAARYKQMLSANPAEGIAVERLWSAAVEAGQTEALLAEFRAGGTFATEMVLGHFLRRSGRDADAAAAFARAAKVDAGSPLPFLAIAKLETDRTRPRDAAAALEKAVALLKADDARLPDTLLQLGTAWAAAGDAVQAAKAWERTVSLNPADLALRRRLADSYAAGFFYDEAIGHLRVVVERAPVAERAAALQQIAKLHSSAGRPAESMAALEEAAAMTAPGNWLRTELNGQIIRLAQRQHIEGALEEKWRKDAEGNPRDLGSALRMVEFYERTGALAPQQQWLERVCGLAPKATDFRLRLARVLLQLDNLEAAAAQLDQIISARPGDADLVFERARLDLQREDGAAARERISHLLAARKSDDALRAKALEFYQEHRLLDLAEEAMKADAAAGSAEALQSLATFYFSQKKDAEAFATLGRLVRPNDPPASRAAAHFQIAQALKLQTSLSSAADQVRQAVELAPEVREYHVMLGELLTSLGLGAEARKPLAQAWALSKDDAERLEADQKLFSSFRSQSLAPDEDPDLVPRKKNATAAEVEDYIRELMSLAMKANKADAWLRVARWKAWNGDKGGAKTYADKAGGIEPKNPLPVEFMAQLAATTGDQASAALHLRALLQLNPDGREGYSRQLAQIELLSGNIREAVRIFEELARRNPGSPDALADLAAAQERGGQLVPALETWRRAHTIAPPQRKREFSASVLRVLQRQEKHEEASDLLLRLVDETPDEKEKSGRFDELLLHAQQHNQLAWLREKLEQRRKVRADDYFTAVSLGRVLKLLGEKAAAFELFADAVFFAPNQEQALPELIREAEELRRWDVAIRLQEQLTRVANLDRPDGFLKLATLQEKTGDLAGAERTWGRAAAKFPRDIDVLRKGAEFHLAWGDTARATMLLRKLQVLDPANPRVAVELGVMESVAGNFTGAKAAFESVLKVAKPLSNLTLYPTRSGDSPWTERVSFERGASGNSSIYAGGGRSDIRPAWMSGDMFAISPSGARMEPADRIRREIVPARSGAAVARLGPEAEWRLMAIRGASEAALRIGGTTLDTWIRDWTEAAKNTPNEAVWALFFCGQPGRALDIVEASMDARTGDISEVQAFVSMALESRNFARLSRWLESGRAAGTDFAVFSIALAEHLKKNDALSADEFAQLFPANASARIWQSAMEFARNRDFESALALGQRAAGRLVVDRAGTEREMARWSLPLGRMDEARRLLRDAAAQPAESFESHPIAALVELHGLTPHAERAAFLEKELAATKGDDLQAQLRRTVLLRLAGRRADSLTEMHHVLDRHVLGQVGLDRSNSAHRELLSVAGAADMFIQWNMPDLAAGVWARAVFDTGLSGLRSRLLVRERVEGSRVGSMWTRGDAVEDIYDAGEHQLDALRYAIGGPVEKAEILAERARTADRNGSPQSGRVVADPGDRDEPFLSLAEDLRNLQAWPGAVEVCFRAWERNHESPRVLRELLDACQRAGDNVTAETVRRQCVEDNINPGNDSTLRQFAIELVDSLERRGAAEEALRIIAGALDGSPGDFALLRRQALLFQRMGRADEAEKTLRKLAKMDGGTAVARAQLAAIHEERGEFAEALETRTRGGGFDPRVPLLLFKNNRADEAVALLEKFSGTTALEPAGELATGMALAGDLANAKSVLLSLASRLADPRAQFGVRAKLLSLPGDRPTPEFVGRMKARMRAIADERPEMTDRYYEFFDKNASRLGVAAAWQEEVVRRWSEPDAPLSAGFSVLNAQIAAKQNDAAEKTVQSMLSRASSLRFPFSKLTELLDDSGLPALKLPVLKRAMDFTLPLPAALEETVMLLDSLGRREDARAELARLDWMGTFPGHSVVLGRLWMGLGDAEKAADFFQDALRDRPMSSQSAALAGMAQVHAARGSKDAAFMLLRRAYLEPSFTDFGPFVDVLSRIGELNRWTPVAAELGVRKELLHDLRLAVFSHYERAGRIADAFGLVVASPEVVSPVNPQRIDIGPKAAISFARIRALAKKSGEFPKAIELLEAVRNSGAPDLEPELAMLKADWFIAKGEPDAATPELISAAKLRPLNWEYVRRAALALISAKRNADAAQALERFISAQTSAVERDAAIELWGATRKP